MYEYRVFSLQTHTHFHWVGHPFFSLHVISCQQNLSLFFKRYFQTFLLQLNFFLLVVTNDDHHITLQEFSLNKKNYIYSFDLENYFSFFFFETFKLLLDFAVIVIFVLIRNQSLCGPLFLHTIVWRAAYLSLLFFICKLCSLRVMISANFRLKKKFEMIFDYNLYSESHRHAIYQKRKWLDYEKHTHSYICVF